MSPAPTTGELRAAERIGIGPVFALVSLSLVVWLVHASTRQADQARTDFLAALRDNTAAVSKLSGDVAAVTAAVDRQRELGRIICQPLAAAAAPSSSRVQE